MDFFWGGGAPAPPWAAAAAVGPGGEGEDRLGCGHIRILYEAPENFTSPNRLYKAIRPYKQVHIRQKPQNA